MLNNLNLPQISKNVNLKELLRRQDLNYRKVAKLNDELKALPEDVLEELEIEAKYEGYIKREQNEIKEIKKMENFVFPENFNFSSIPSLSKDAKESLEKYAPRTLEEALRLQGIKPSDALTLLSIFSKIKN